MVWTRTPSPSIRRMIAPRWRREAVGMASRTRETSRSRIRAGNRPGLYTRTPSISPPCRVSSSSMKAATARPQPGPSERNSRTPASPAP